MFMNNEKHYNFSPAAGLISSQQRPNWVVDNLIEKGEQWIINGSPKTGKSMLATQLGLAVASGSVFLNWEIKRPALVLYMDFEVNDRLFWQRYYTMSEQTNLGDAKNIKTFLRCGDYKSTDVLDPMASQAIIDIVNDIQPDLIIWDVLARMHNAEENNNGEMGQVMRAIRKIGGSAAHIIVHHARKASPNAGGVNAGVMSMRGASSIHGEADGVISLGTREGQGARYSLTFSARAVETPDEILLNRIGLTLVSAIGEERDKLMDGLLEALEGQAVISATTLTERFCQYFSVKERQAKNYIKKCVDNGWVTRVATSERTEYVLTDGIAITHLADSSTSAN